MEKSCGYLLHSQKDDEDDVEDNDDDVEKAHQD